MRYIIIVSFILCFCNSISGQTRLSSQVATKVLDEKQNPVEGATVSLLNSKDSSLVKINISEKDGSVMFENMKEGSYIISATSLGFKKALSPPFVVDHDHPQTVLSSINMEHVTGELKEVSIQEKKPFIERQLDRIVINVNSSIVSAGSSALDVLSRSPGVLVNQDDAISLKGKQGVIVMIDDKPTYLSATDLANLLRSTPASSIDKIELITNPSAKYDAAGSSGIINIKLKKDQRYGVNGSVNSSLGQGVYGKLNEGISLNYRKNNINIFGNYNYTYRESFNHLMLDRRFLNNGAVSSAYKQDDYLTLPLKSHLAKAGFDYTVSKKTTVGVVFNTLLTQFNPGGENSSNDLDSLLRKVSSYKTSTQAKNKLDNFSGNFNFRHKIDTAGQEVTGDLDYAHYGNNSMQIYDTRYFALDGTSLQPDNILQDNQTGALDIYSIKVDYVKPLKKQAKIEAGFKSSYVREDNNLATYNLVNTVAMFDTSKSNHFIYDENINAAYVNYSKEWQKYKLQVGARAEQTIVKGDQLATNKTLEIHTSNYSRVYF
jgi:iron complex outermembrane receptor protein